MARPVVPVKHSNEVEHRRQLANAVKILSESTPDLRQTPAESAAGVTPVDTHHEAYNVLRYDADPTGAADSSAAFQAAVNAAIEGKGTVIVPGGVYRLDTQIAVEGNCSYWQSAAALVSSHVTGSIDGYDTAGFGLLIDGMSECDWYGHNWEFTNATAGVVFRCRNGHTRLNRFHGYKNDGGTFGTAKLTRSKILIRFIGNEASANSTGNVCYFNKFFGANLVSASTLVDMVTGDGDAATRQPNQQVFMAATFQDYITAVRPNDSDQHIIDAFYQLASSITSGVNPTATQAAGVATASHTAHGYETGDIVTWSGANETEYNGAHRITVTGDNAYTFSIDSGASSPATGTITSVLNTVGFRGRSAFSTLFGQIDAPVGAYPYWLYPGSGATKSFIAENTSVGGVVEDTTDNVFSLNNSRINGLSRINNKPHDVDGDADINLFGDGANAQSGAGISKFRAFGNLGSTRHIEMYIEGTVARLRAMVAGTTLELGADGETLATLDKSATATHTALLLYDTDNDTIERVTVGAPDSGGSGFKVLRIPN